MATSPLRVEPEAPYRRLRASRPLRTVRGPARRTPAPAQFLSQDAAVRMGFAPRETQKWWHSGDLRDAATTFALTFTAAMILFF